TVVGRGGQHRAYADALLAELSVERGVLARTLESVFLGGGTPTFTAPGELRRLLGALRPAEEVTVEANPETVTPAVAALLREGGGAPLLLRAGGEAGDALHPRARRRARAPGRGDGVVLRARRRARDGCRLPLVRDGELLPAAAARGRARPALASQPRVLAEP